MRYALLGALALATVAGCNSAAPPNPSSPTTTPSAALANDPNTVTLTVPGMT